MVKHLDVNGNELTERPDYNTGRDLPGADGNLVFSPWDTVPLRPEESALVTAPCEDDRITALEDAVAAMALM